LAFYGRATASALSGRFSSRYTMFNDSTDQLLAAANWKDDRLVGRFEAEVGVSCYSKDEHWRVSAGYLFSQWTNMITTPEFITGVQFDNYVRLGDSIGFEGLVGRVECRW
jgi:hypothetical protein